MPLTDPAVRNAKPRSTPYKLSDGRGLYLLIVPSGGKRWRYDYRFLGKRKTLAIGVYPDVSLKVARGRRDDARRQLDEGIDPSALKNELNAPKDESNHFEAVAREWIARQAPKWTTQHKQRVQRRLEADVFPWLGHNPIHKVSPQALLRVLRRIESRGAIDTAHRAKQNCGQIFRYAVATGRADRDPSADLRDALTPIVSRHHSSISDPKTIGELLRAIDSYAGSFITRCALQLGPLVFVRPKELRHAEWSEIDTEAAEWRIPASKMKARALHIVPLSTQAIAVLEELRPLTGSGVYLFPGLRSRTRPMSENTVNAALRRLGYSKEEMTGHGFRSMASTLLNEQGWHRDAIERQLAHSDRDKTRASYNYAEHLPERRRMMQAWADTLDTLREKGVMVPIKRKRS